MANRYGYQYDLKIKPRMASIEGFVSVGTGGQLNYPPAYPIFPVATGPTGGLGGQTGVPPGLLPGTPTTGVPTGWVGGFSGCWGLLGAGVQGIQRVATGLYAVQLQDDWVRLDSCNIGPYIGATGVTNLSDLVVAHTIGQGNTVATGGFTLPQFPGPNPKNMIWIQFHASGVFAELPAGGGFWIDMRLRDALEGPQ